MIKKCLSVFTLAIMISVIPVMAGETDASTEESTVAETDPIRALRDEIEMQQLISYDPDRQIELSSIITDLSTEPEEIKTLGLQVLDYLAKTESYNSLIVILGEDWFPTMLPEDLVIGQRNYHYEGNPTDPIFSGDITVISDELGEKYTYVRVMSQQYGLTYLEAGPDAIHFVLNNGQENEQYFVAQTMYMDDGTFISNEGFVNEKDELINGLIVYMSDLQLVNESTEIAGYSPLGAWATRFDNGMSYNGTFDAEGKTTIITPEEMTGQVCYAMQDTAGETQYLSIEDDADHIFTGEEFGLYTFWDE